MSRPSIEQWIGIPGQRLFLPNWGQGGTGAVTRIQTYPPSLGRVGAISIGSDSHYSSVEIKAPKFPEPFRVSVDKPWVGSLDGPLVVTPTWDNIQLVPAPIDGGRLDLQFWQTPPRYLPTKRSPYVTTLPTTAGAAVATTNNFVIEGRAYLRVVIRTIGAVNVTYTATYFNRLGDSFDVQMATDAGGALATIGREFALDRVGNLLNGAVVFRIATDVAISNLMIQAFD